MRRVAAIWPCHNVTSKAGCASWPSMATGAAINQSGTDCQIRFDVTHAVQGKRSNSLYPCVLPLKELTSAPNCSKGIPLDDEYRGVWSHHVTVTRSYLFDKRLVNSHTRRVGRNCLIRKLRITPWDEVGNRCDANKGDSRKAGSIGL